MNEEQPQVKAETPVDTAEPVFYDNDKKPTSTGLIIGMVIFAVLALGGIAFGVWEMMQGSDKDKQIVDLKTQVANCAIANDNAETENTTVTCPDGTATEIINNVISNDLAQNLIKPYIGFFRYLNNVFDYEFDDTTKFIIAFNNLSRRESGDDLKYYTINNIYKSLFGINENIEKKDYTGACEDFTYHDDGVASSSDGFKINVGGCGGTGAAMFSIVKSAKYSGNDILVDVYHNVVPVCHPDSYVENCMDIGVNSAIIDSMEQYNMRDYIAKYSDSIPVYTMTFTKDDGHYVLKDIKKQ